MNYSIIIPHRNIPHLLQRLLSSIPQRNDMEVIIVDDNSNPECVDFEYFPGIERNDTKVIFDKKGGGGGYARNIGLSHATGERVVFADADDFFNYCFNDVLDDCLNVESDIVYCKAASLDSDFYTPTFRTNHLNRYVDSFLKGDKAGETNLRYMFGEPWCKIIKKSLIVENQIKFDETSIHNDTTFSYLCGFHAKSVAVDKRAIYNVTSREGSVSVQISETKKKERIMVFSRSYVFFRKHGLDVVEERHFKQLYECKRENVSTYKEGLEIMISSGIPLRVIRIRMLKQYLCHLYPLVLLGRLKRHLKYKIREL